jgi:hypothetical protein
MVLSQYLAITQSLIQTPQSPIPLLTTALLTQYINVARGQVAGQGECFPALGTLAVTPAQNEYAFGLITFPEATLIGGVINVRMITRPLPNAGQSRLYPREWPWFNNYVIAKPIPAVGPPRIWAQYRQGNQGTLFINLLDANYTLQIDAICYPVDLVDDNTPDGIPYLWSDAVPFYAAFYAYMAMQRQADADMMLRRFQDQMGRARAAVTPGVLPGSYPQGPDPMLPNRLGVHPAAQRGQPTAGAMG